MNRRDFMRASLASATAMVASDYDAALAALRQSPLAPAIPQAEPRPRVRSLDWFREHVSTMDGRPYDHGAYPHLGAPGGPCDALDDPNTLTIWLQWASRLGKTFFGQAASLYQADMNPAPLMFVSESEKLAVEVVGRTYKMLERCGPLKSQLRPVTRRRQSQVDLDNCRMYVGWARSVSTLADKAVRWGHANEIDKWSHETTSKEADPLKLFTDRGKEFPSRKFIFESTPTVKGRSRIERGRLASTNCQMHVPCPHCKSYQRLKMGDGDSPGGIVWSKGPGGKSDKETARSTARYVCEHCTGTIKDEHRAWMMRRGVWCPEGCQVDSPRALVLTEGIMASLTRAKGSDGTSAGDDSPYVWRGWSHAEWITGDPSRNGRDAGYQLSSLYALQLGWGDIAAEFVESKDKPQLLRNFINQWLAETWEISKRETTWESLGNRVISTLPRGIVPLWGSLLTVGIDRQSAGGDRFPWVVDAWGAEERNATIAYGECSAFEELREQVLMAHWHHEDGGSPLRISFGLFDSGHNPLGVYDFCLLMSQRNEIPLWPCKGSSTALDSDYRQVVLGPNTAKPGMILLHVDTIRSQVWIEDQLSNEKTPYSIHAGSLLEHQDFLEQLLNDGPVYDTDSANNIRESWKRLDESIPNDFRDSRRYARVAMLIATRGRPVAERTREIEVPKKRPAVLSTGSAKTPRW